MAVRQEIIENGFAQWAGPWQTVFLGVPVAPYNQPNGYWENQPGGATVGGYFQNAERRRVVKIGMQWQSGSYDGEGLVLQWARATTTPGAYGWETYAPTGIAIDCKAMGLTADGVYREYTLPTAFPARGIQWFKGFDDPRIPFNGTIQKIRIFTDTWSPASAEQGTVRLVEPFGAGQPPVTEGTSGAWEIYDEAYTLVAWRGSPVGWNVAWNGTCLVVKRPLTANPHANYLVRFRE